MYKALDVARLIITLCSKRGNPISNLKLQKLLYYLWIYYYKITGKELFCEKICAWQFGPVVPEVYYKFCPYGGSDISIEYDTNEIGRCDLEIIKEFINGYGNIPAYKLVDMTHKQGNPWDSIYKSGKGNRRIIPYELIKNLEC